MRLLILLLTSCLVAACAGTSTRGSSGPAVPRQPAGTVKNVIFVVGDGMGPQQIGLVELYTRYAPASVVPERTLAMTRLMNEGEVGLMLTEPYGKLVADSAVSATQMATGVPSRSEMIGLDKDGNAVPTLLERARDAGRSTGVITNARVTHATPAAFVAHELHRSRENEIAADYLDSLPTVVFGGGIRHFVPRAFSTENNPHGVPAHLDVVSSREDDRDLLAELKAEGYDVFFTRDAMAQTGAERMLGLFDKSSLPDPQTLIAMSPRTVPSVAEMTAKALTVLSKNPEGFVLVVEAAQIDWAGHNNDAGGMLHALLGLDAALREIYAFAKDRSDTLVVVVGDHETGSFGFSYSGTNLPAPVTLPDGRKHQPGSNFGDHGLLGKLYDQKTTWEKLCTDFQSRPKPEQTAARLAAMVNDASAFPITEDQACRILKAAGDDIGSQGPALIGRAVAPAQNVVWGTSAHTATPIVIIAYGPEAVIDRFDGIQHAADVGRQVQEAAGLR